MKTKSLMLLIIICFAPALSQHPNVYLNSVYFSDSLHGCIVGDSGVVLNTTSGGLQWQLSQMGVPSTGLFSVHLVDTANGWAGGDGYILRTRDGGKSWSPFPISAGPLFSVLFVDTSTGFVAGTQCGVFKTTNGGQTWIQKNGVVGSRINLYSIGFINPNHGWAAGSSGASFNGALFWTENGGENWSIIDTNIAPYIRDFQFVNDSIGFLGGLIGIYKTTNRGISWTQKSSGNIYDLQFIDSHTGWAVGDLGAILKSTDDGNSWVPQVSTTTDALNSVHFVDGQHGWAVGGWHTTIVATSDGGLHWNRQNGTTDHVTSHVYRAPMTEKLEQNYPNPFNPTTQIDYDLPRNEFVLIKVIDILGRELRTLVHGQQESGHHHIELDARDMPSGIYIYQLVANGYILTKKMVLMK